MAKRYVDRLLDRLSEEQMEHLARIHGYIYEDGTPFPARASREMLRLVLEIGCLDIGWSKRQQGAGGYLRVDE
jgi:hypothetical protein